MLKEEILADQLTFQAYLNQETDSSKSLLLLKTAIQKTSSISLAKALSNYSIVLRQRGELQEAKEYMDKAWNTTIVYLKNQQDLGMSNYLDMALRATGLEGDKVQRVFRETRDTNAPAPQEISQGPPIVVWIFELLNNMGLLSLARGKYDTALKCFTIVKRLAENVLEEYPPPDSILHACMDANSSALSSGSSNGRNSSTPTPGRSPSTSTGLSALSRTNSANSTDLKRSNTNLSKTSDKSVKKFQLSYLHRHTILALVRSLTHTGVIHHLQSHLQSALNHLLAAHGLLSLVCDLSPTFQIISPRNIHTPNLQSSQTEPQFGIEVLKLKSTITTNLAVVSLSLPDFPTSILYLRKSLTIQTHIIDILTPKSYIKRISTSLARTLTRISAVQMRFGSLAKMFGEGGEETIDYSLLQVYIQIYRQRILGDKWGMAVGLLNLAVGYVKMKRGDIASLYLKRAVEMGNLEIFRDNIYMLTSQLGLTMKCGDVVLEGFLRMDMSMIKLDDYLMACKDIRGYFSNKGRRERWVYSLDMTIAKILWQRGMYLPSLTHLQKSTAALLNMDVILPTTSLILAAEHFESGSDGVVKSILTVEHFRLLSQLLSEIQRYGLTGPEGLHIPPGNLSQVQKGLHECSEYLVLLELDVCEQCKGSVGDGSLLFNNQIGGCMHGFGISVV